MNDVKTYDLVIVGGGIAGSTFARSMAKLGYRVLVIEKEKAFTDRIRGEILMPWGSAEAAELGIYDLLSEECAVEIPAEISYMDGAAAPQRDFRSTTPSNTVGLAFYHPRMQELLLMEAAASGAEVWRGAVAKATHTDVEPRLSVLVDGKLLRVGARLIVVADGRDSQLATMLAFDRQRDPAELFTGGFQCSGALNTPDALRFFLNCKTGRGAILVRTGTCNYRIYILHHRDALERRLSGARDYKAAFDNFLEIGIPSDWLGDLTPHGIFATFDGAHRWISRPARGGFVLIGDAAATSDPAWGNGLSRSLRDVRLLRDQLIGHHNWLFAADAYAAQHDEHFHQLRRAERLNAAIFFAMGEDGEARRERAFALMDAHPNLYPDLIGSGPDLALTDTTVEFFAGTPS